MDVVLAQENLRKLTANPYPGRGLVIGLDEWNENMIQVYWITGRSPNSRNRVFVTDGGRLFTEPADPNKVENPELIIYNAMMQKERNFFAVSNGHQTDAVIEKADGTKDLLGLLDGWTYEPDEPNWTPRITGLITLTEWPRFELATLWRNHDGHRNYYTTWSLGDPGYGEGLTTYTGDGNPLPSFTGEPILLPLRGSQRDIRDTYWDALNPENRVALAVKFINPNGRNHIDVINRFQKI